MLSRFASNVNEDCRFIFGICFVFIVFILALFVQVYSRLTRAKCGCAMVGMPSFALPAVNLAMVMQSLFVLFYACIVCVLCILVRNPCVHGLN